MKRTISSVIVILGFCLILYRCFDSLEIYPPEHYHGDGSITFIEEVGVSKPGWLIKFNEFSLSSGYKHTYSFTGLPGVEKKKYYYVFLHTPPSFRNAEFDQTTLQITLYGNGKKLSTESAAMKDWLHCGLDYLDKNEDAMDGGDKNFMSIKVSIPYDPEVQYKLEVKYTPSESIEKGRTGHFFIIM